MTANKKRIVSAPLSGAAYVTTKSTLIHAVEVDSDDTPLRVLCGKVKVSSVLDDSSQYDVDPITCPVCIRKLES